jgi:hypothetical protein
MTISSTLASISDDRIYPATFLQAGLASYSFMESTFNLYFSRTYFIFIKSPANSIYFAFMYSLMYFSLYLNAASKICAIFSLTAFISLLSNRPTFELNASIL